MLPINVKRSQSAARIGVRVSCKKCGHESIELLTRFHGRYYIVCRSCLGRIDLKLKENRIILERLAQYAAELDATLAQPD